jgi:D-alanyl-D-alanine carboxypeptidase/D-alanyl-D-alanine-endopeptidase (penicillin-binding protein 4)
MACSSPGRVCIAVAAACLLVATPARAVHRKAPPPAPRTLEQRLLAIARRPPVARAEAGIVVQRVGETSPVLAVNADRPLILASTTKLFTTAAALDRLGPEYRFRTRIYRDGEVGSDGVLPGHLIVVGGGDPGISGRWYDDDPLAVFRPWAESLAKRGIREVRGGLLLDVSFFDDVKVHPDWPSEQEARWYQAPVSALSYNDNVVIVRASGGVRPGAPALLGFDPLGPPLLNLISQVVTAARWTRIGVRRDAGSNNVVAAGAVGRNRTWTGDVTVPDPPLYFAGAFGQILSERGIRVSAPPTEQTQAAPGGTRVLVHTHETPILPVLAVCNKRSQSFFAEQILKTLGAETHGKGTWETGREAVGSFLASLGLDPARYQLADGSGRAHTNKASAGAYVDFLEALATKWKEFENFKPTLAISGESDGTLRHRLLTEATRGRVFAKTGNVSGVSTLCGYITAQSGQTYAFAILLNGGARETRGHSFQDRLLQEIASRG